VTYPRLRARVPPPELPRDGADPPRPPLGRDTAPPPRLPPLGLETEPPPRLPPLGLENDPPPPLGRENDPPPDGRDGAVERLPIDGIRLPPPGRAYDGADERGCGIADGREDRYCGAEGAADRYCWLEGIDERNCGADWAERDRDLEGLESYPRVDGAGR
jgi:hypothetical protein